MRSEDSASLASVIAETTIHFLKAGAGLDVKVAKSNGSLESICSIIRDDQLYAQGPGISREKRGLTSLWDAILDFIALRRAARDTNTPLSAQSLLLRQSGPEPGNTDTTSVSGLAAPMEGNVGRTSRRRLRYKPVTESGGGVGGEAGPAMKKRRYDVDPSANKHSRT